MSEQTGRLSSLALSFALGAMAGALAVVMLVMFGGFGWSGAVFTGGLLALAIGIYLAVVLGKPLPTMAQVQSRAAPVAPVAAPPAPVAAPVVETVAPVAAPAAPAAAAKPVFMTAARGGQPDDLKLIKGVGPKLEQMLHGMGVFHFDQIAGWTASEVAWVDDNLEGFKGRVSRDGWVDQARTLAAGGSV
jgi:NADH-quinone oxidoreductase subunit E